MTESEHDAQAVAGAFDRHARDYDAARRMLVPCFEDFYASAMAAIPFAADAAISFVDIGAGTGLMADMALKRWPSARAVLIDVAGDMLDVARERLAAHGDRVRFRNTDYVCDDFPRGVDVAMSALSIHHIGDADKKRLFTRIFDALNPGGVFVNAEQVLGATPAIEARYREMWEQLSRARGATDADIGAAKERMRHDRAAPLADQMRWLEEVGFVDVDCPFKHYAFAVYAGRKPT